MLRQFRREPDAVHRLAEEARTLCLEYRFDYYGAWSDLMLAWAAAKQLSLEQGIASYHLALENFRRTGAVVRLPHYLCLLAGIHRQAGEASDARRLLDEAAQIAQRTQESWCSAEIERERGKLFLLDPAVDARDKADAAFGRARDIAAGQGAKMLELRTGIAQARLWVERGERGKALEILAPIYAWFSEGFDTPDMRRAKALIDELRVPCW